MAAIQWDSVASDLMRLRDEGRITPQLRQAIEEILAAANDHNYELAEELTAVKSFITSRITKGYAFGEDAEYNERRIGFTAYGFLDGLHHDLALRLSRVPAGMMIATAEGTREHPSVGIRGRGPVRGAARSRTLSRMELEHLNAVKRAKDWERQRENDAMRE